MGASRGDSITSRIEEAITNASALLVVLSRASVDSPWCRREMNSGLVRELRAPVVVLPVLVEDCAIPLFLRDKLYADFRTSFDDGLRTVLEATARISNPSTGRVEGPTFHADWSLDWGQSNGNAIFRITIIQQAVDQQFTVLSVVSIMADDEGDRNYGRLVDEYGTEQANTDLLSLVMRTLTESNDLRITLTDQFEQAESYACVTDSGTFRVIVSARRLGLDNGRDVIVNLGTQLQELTEDMRSVMERPSSN